MIFCIDAADCMQFNREKVPERVVHARGFTVKGYFEVRHLCTALTATCGWCQRLHLWASAACQSCLLLL